MIRGYIFDMDGVLCDSEAFIAEAAMRMFHERYGVEVLTEDFVPFVGAGEDRYLAGVAEKYGIRLRLADDKRETYRLYGECVRGRLKPLPGVKEFIYCARNKGLRLAVATSADETKLMVNLREIGLDPALFDALVNGLDIAHKKPAPDIFLEAARRLELDPAECIVFEDAINGIQAAQAAGARSIGITSSFPGSLLLEAGAEAVFPHFESLAPPG